MAKAMRAGLAAGMMVVAVGCGGGSGDLQPTPTHPEASVLVENGTVECPLADYHAAFSATDGSGAFVTCIWRCADYGGAHAREVLAETVWAPPVWSTNMYVSLGGDCD